MIKNNISRESSDESYRSACEALFNSLLNNLDSIRKIHGPQTLNTTLRKRPGLKKFILEYQKMNLDYYEPICKQVDFNRLKNIIDNL